MSTRARLELQEKATRLRDQPGNKCTTRIRHRKDPKGSERRSRNASGRRSTTRSQTRPHTSNTATHADIILPQDSGHTPLKINVLGNFSIPKKYGQSRFPRNVTAGRYSQSKEIQTPRCRNSQRRPQQWSLRNLPTTGHFGTFLHTSLIWIRRRLQPKPKRKRNPKCRAKPPPRRAKHRRKKIK